MVGVRELRVKVSISFREDTECDTHEVLGCHCGGLGEVSEAPQPEERSCQLGRQVETKQEDQLADWSHVAAPVENIVQDSVLNFASQFVSFVMLKSFHSDK